MQQQICCPVAFALSPDNCILALVRLLGFRLSKIPCNAMQRLVNHENGP